MTLMHVPWGNFHVWSKKHLKKASNKIIEKATQNEIDACEEMVKKSDGCPVAQWG